MSRFHRMLIVPDLHGAENKMGQGDVMFSSFTPLLAASPQDTRAALAFGYPLAHLAYQVGPALTLRRGSIGQSMRGGVMVLSDAETAHVSGDPEALLAEAMRECQTRDFQGLVADFEHGARKGLMEFLRLADTVLPRKGITLFVYERCASFAPGARVIVSTALTAGSLANRLQEAIQIHGGGRVCVEIERLARDIVLPAPQGMGDALSRDALQAILEKRNATVFFSSELCAHYFTYRDAQGQTHFVLYDDAASIRKKLALCQRMGVREAFLLYPEVRDILLDIKEG